MLRFQLKKYLIVLKLYFKIIKDEISRFARNDKVISLFGEKLERGETLVPILGDPSQKAFGMTLRVGSERRTFALFD
jgi:hypothetical protein